MKVIFALLYLVMTVMIFAMIDMRARIDDLEIRDASINARAAMILRLSGVEIVPIKDEQE